MRYLSFILITIVLVAGGVAYLRPELISQFVAPPLVVTKTTTIPSAPSTATTSVNHYHYETVGVSYDYLERRLAELMVERTIIIDRRSESGSRRGGSSGGSATVDDVTPDQLAATDFGDFTCNGTTCDLDAESYDLEELSDVGAMTEVFGDVLMWNGTTWTNVATSSLGIGAGSGSPGGANTQVQFNSGGMFAGNAGFTYDAAANRVTVTYASSTALSTVYASSTNAFFGNLSVGTLTGPLQANNGVVSATTSVGVLYGGTGLTTAPTYGQVLVGNALGGYTLTATSSLGITGGGSGLTSYDAWTHPAAGQSATTSLMLFNGNASSTQLSAGLGYFGTTATTTISGNGSVALPSGATLTIGTLSGLLKATNGLVSAATAGTDYIAGGAGAATSSVSCAGTASCTSFVAFSATPITITGTGLSAYDAWTHPAAGQSATTSLMLFNGNASSTQLSAYAAYFGATGTTTITGAGFVGVGSSSPWAQLSINPTSANGSAPAFAIGSSTASSFVVTNAGNVGIGSTSPAARLGVTGNIYTTGDLVLGGGTGKLTVGTVDPVYTVDGVNYATYVSGMVGIKEEVTGAAEIDTPVTADDGSSGYVAVLDFDEELPGSDLWLFAQATHIRKHIDRLVVLLSAENGARVWYEIDEAERKVYLLSDAPTRVSYRMTAPRFDTADWTNYNLDGITGFKPPSNDIGNYFSELFTLSFGSTTEYLSEGLTEALRAWFADATNGIGSLMANVFSAKEKICVDGECLTKDDIRVLLQLVGEERGGNGGGNEEPPVEEEPSPTPEEPLPEEEPEPEPEPELEAPEEPPSAPEEPAGEEAPPSP